MREDIIPIARSKSSAVFLSGKESVFGGLLIPNKNLFISEYLDDEVIRYKDERELSIFFSKIGKSKVNFSQIMNTMMSKFSLDKKFPLETYRFSVGDPLSIGKNKARKILAYLNSALSINISLKNLELSYSLLNRQILQKGLTTLNQRESISIDVLENNLFGLSGDYNLRGFMNNLIDSKIGSIDSNSVYVIDGKVRKKSEIVKKMYFMLFTYLYSDDIMKNIIEKDTNNNKTRVAKDFYCQYF